MARWAAAADATLGRVARVDRGLATVLTEDGPVRAGLGGGLLGSIAHDPVAAPCTGDWCVLRSWPDHRTTVERLLPRRTALVRATAGRTSLDQVLCANVDLAAVVVSLHPDPVMARVERLLAVARQSGARPLVVLTKADAVSDAGLVAEDVRAVAGDAEVVVTSATTGAGLDRLRDLLEGHLTMALLGASGHGKSSLVNALVGADVLATRAIRQDGRGRHTSVRRELVLLPGGGALVDTPGLRGVGLVDAAKALDATFADIAALAAHCRFTDCTHRTEPGCAVQRALAEGALAMGRYERWRKLTAETAEAERRRQRRLRAQGGGGRHRRRGR
jgi:ribosome biogenesis GTPase